MRDAVKVLTNPMLILSYGLFLYFFDLNRLKNQSAIITVTQVIPSMARGSAPAKQSYSAFCFLLIFANVRPSNLVLVYFILRIILLFSNIRYCIGRNFFKHLVLTLIFNKCFCIKKSFSFANVIFR